MDLAALIAKLEQASEGSRELDAEIAKEAGWRIDGEHMGLRRWIDPEGRQTAFNPDHDNAPFLWFTRSIDAALKLVPPEWTDIDISICSAEFAGKVPPKCCAMLVTGDLNNPRTKQVVAHADRPAMSLTIAALKARAALSPDPQS